MGIGHMEVFTHTGQQWHGRSTNIIHGHNISVAAFQTLHAIERAADVVHLINICHDYVKFFGIVHINSLYSVLFAIKFSIQCQILDGEVRSSRGTADRN
jgi:hypothetical protein